MTLLEKFNLKSAPMTIEARVATVVSRLVAGPRPGYLSTAEEALRAARRDRDEIAQESGRLMSVRFNAPDHSKLSFDPKIRELEPKVARAEGKVRGAREQLLVARDRAARALLASSGEAIAEGHAVLSELLDLADQVATAMRNIDNDAAKCGIESPRAVAHSPTLQGTLRYLRGLLK